MNTQQRYDLLFRGDIVPGSQLGAVRGRVQALFQLDDPQVARLFSGRPMIIRRGLAAAEAERYRAALAEAGALVELRPVAGEAVAGAAAPGAAAPMGDDWSLAPVGADVLRPEERAAPAPVAVDIDHLSVEPPGADVLRADERRRVTPVDIDTSHFDLDPADD